MATATEEPYDQLVSRFGIMFFDDPLAAFANLTRWLAPGGRFAFTVWCHPAENPWMTSVRQVAEIIDLPLPLRRRISHSHPYSSFGEPLAEAGNTVLNDARKSLTACLSRHQGDGVRMDACVHIFTAVRLGSSAADSGGVITKFLQSLNILVASWRAVHESNVWNKVAWTSGCFICKRILGR
jgi:SAM-dependent methyltransferase